MNVDDVETIDALGRLDPAPGGSAGNKGSPLTPAQSRRAELTLRQILATDPDRPAPQADPLPSRPRRWSRRWVVVPLAGLVGAAVVVVPGLTTGGHQAYASWSPVPVPLSSTESAAAAGACLDKWDREAAVPATVVLAERRGGWTYVLIQVADGENSCIMPAEEIPDPAADRHRWFGSGNAEVPEPVQNADEVRVDGAALGTMKEGRFSFTEGAVGRDVVDLTFTTPRGVTVKASVASGRFAVWWPAGKNYLRSPEHRAPVIDVTLADGTTYRLVTGADGNLHRRPR